MRQHHRCPHSPRFWIGFHTIMRILLIGWISSRKLEAQTLKIPPICSEFQCRIIMPRRVPIAIRLDLSGHHLTLRYFCMGFRLDRNKSAALTINILRWKFDLLWLFLGRFDSVGVLSTNF